MSLISHLPYAQKQLLFRPLPQRCLREERDTWLWPLTSLFPEASL